VQSFGTYDTEAEAVAAFDIGTILAFGTREKSLNESFMQYMTDGKLKESVQIPPRVQESIQGYLNTMQSTNPHRMEEHLSRIRSYFPDGSCPFYDSRNML
jgi:hypothetical protein